MSDKDKKTPMRSRVATKTVVLEPAAVPGCFPINTPSVLEAAPSDFEHIYHQPSVYMTPDGPVQAAPILPASDLLSTKKDVESTPGKSATSKTSAAGKPVNMTSSVSKKTVVVSQTKAADSMKSDPATTSAVPTKTPFDMDAYLASVGSSPKGGSVVYTDPWTRKKVSIPRSSSRD